MLKKSIITQIEKNHSNVESVAKYIRVYYFASMILDNFKDTLSYYLKENKFSDASDFLYEFKNELIQSFDDHKYFIYNSYSNLQLADYTVTDILHIWTEYFDVSQLTSPSYLDKEVLKLIYDEMLDEQWKDIRDYIEKDEAFAKLSLDKQKEVVIQKLYNWYNKLEAEFDEANKEDKQS